MSDTELLHKSKPEPVRRLEVFTGAGRRRAWTAEQKAEILAESYEGGEKVSAVARRMRPTNTQVHLGDARRVVQAAAVVGVGCAAASCAAFQFQGRSSSMALAGWSGNLARTKASQACGLTMPNGSGMAPLCDAGIGHRVHGRLGSIRHSLTTQSASRKASRRSFGWKRVRLPRSYGLSFARAASLRARWACR